MFTRKYYRQIAEVIKAASDAPGYWERNSFLVYALCDMFQADNPRFDRAKFLSACGAGDDNDHVRV